MTSIVNCTIHDVDTSIATNVHACDVRATSSTGEHADREATEVQAVSEYVSPLKETDILLSRYADCVPSAAFISPFWFQAEILNACLDNQHIHCFGPCLSTKSEESTYPVSWGLYKELRTEQ